GKRVIEIPAGLAGDADGHENEELLLAAQRELREETGYEADQWQQVGEGVTSAGMSDEIVTLFLATKLTKVCDAPGDGSEEITLHEVEIGSVESWLKTQMRDGALVDLKVYSALYFALTKQTRV